MPADQAKRDATNITGDLPMRKASNREEPDQQGPPNNEISHHGHRHQPRRGFDIAKLRYPRIIVRQTFASTARIAGR